MSGCEQQVVAKYIEQGFLKVGLCIYVKTWAHFPSIGSDDPPPPPLGVKNVKIREHSEKIRGPLGVP